jgi:hypothetical protein
VVQPVLSVHKAQLEMMEQQALRDQQEVQELMVQPVLSVHKAQLEMMERQALQALKVLLV